VIRFSRAPSTPNRSEGPIAEQPEQNGQHADSDSDSDSDGDLAESRNRSNDQETFFIAAHTGNFQRLRSLAETNVVDVHAVDPSGSTALLLAAKANQTEIVKYLVSVVNLDVNAQEDNGDSALSWAVEHRNIELVIWLIRVARAQVHDATKDGQQLVLRGSLQIATYLFAVDHRVVAPTTFVNGLLALRRYTDPALYDPEEVISMMKEGHKDSSAPISCALVLAWVCKGMAANDIAYTQVFEDAAFHFSQLASWLFNHIPSDVMAALVLQERSEADNSSVLELAIGMKDVHFVTNARVLQIVDDWWTGASVKDMYARAHRNNTVRLSRFVKEENAASRYCAQWIAPRHQRPSFSPCGSLLDPFALVRFPVVKFAFDMISFLMLLAITSLVAAQHYSIDSDTVHNSEVLLYLYGICQVCNLILQSSAGLLGIQARMARVSQFDMLTSFLIAVHAFARIPHSASSQSFWDWNGWAELSFGLYGGATVLLCLATWARLLYLLRYASRTLGTVLKAMPNLARHVGVFLVSAAISIVGFWFAFRFLVYTEDEFSSAGVGPDSAPFEDSGAMLLTLYHQAISGDAEFDALESITDPTRRTFAKVLNALHVLLLAILLVNLLIATMSSTYHANQAEANSKHSYDIASRRWRYAEAIPWLPPPLNVVVMLVYLLAVLPYQTARKCCCRSENSEAARRTQHASRRRSQNDITSFSDKSSNEFNDYLNTYSAAKNKHSQKSHNGHAMRTTSSDRKSAVDLNGNPLSNSEHELIKDVPNGADSTGEDVPVERGRFGSFFFSFFGPLFPDEPVHYGRCLFCHTDTYDALNVGHAVAAKQLFPLMPKRIAEHLQSLVQAGLLCPCGHVMSAISDARFVFERLTAIVFLCTLYPVVLIVLGLLRLISYALVWITARCCVRRTPLHTEFGLQTHIGSRLSMFANMHPPDDFSKSDTQILRSLQGRMRDTSAQLHQIAAWQAHHSHKVSKAGVAGLRGAIRTPRHTEQMTQGDGTNAGNYKPSSRAKQRTDDDDLVSDIDIGPEAVYLVNAHDMPSPRAAYGKNWMQSIQAPPPPPTVPKLDWSGIGMTSGENSPAPPPPPPLPLRLNSFQQSPLPPPLSQHYVSPSRPLHPTIADLYGGDPYESDDGPSDPRFRPAHLAAAMRRQAAESNGSARQTSARKSSASGVRVLDLNFQ
jgi:ankyrin repeat protein